MTLSLTGAVPVSSAPPSPALSSLRALFPVLLHLTPAQERALLRLDQRVARPAERLTWLLVQSVLLRPAGTPLLTAADLRALARRRTPHAWQRAADPTLSVSTPVALNRRAKTQGGGLTLKSAHLLVREALSLPTTEAARLLPPQDRLPFGVTDGAVRAVYGVLRHYSGRPDELALSELQCPRTPDDPPQLTFTNVRLVDDCTVALEVQGGGVLTLPAEVFTVPPWWRDAAAGQQAAYDAWAAEGKPDRRSEGKRRKNPAPPVTRAVVERVGGEWWLWLRLSDAVAAAPSPCPPPDLDVIGLDPGVTRFLTGYDGLATHGRRRKLGRPAGGPPVGPAGGQPVWHQPPAFGEVRLTHIRKTLAAAGDDLHSRHRAFGELLPLLLALFRELARYRRVGCEAQSPLHLQDEAEFALMHHLHRTFLRALLNWLACEVVPGVGRRWVVVTTRTRSSTRCPACRERPVRPEPGRQGGRQGQEGRPEPARNRGHLEGRPPRSGEQGLRVRECTVCGHRGDRDVLAAHNAYLDALDPARPHRWARLPPDLLADLCASPEEGRHAPPDVLRWERRTAVQEDRPMRHCEENDAER